MVEGFYNFAQSVDRKNVAKFFPLCASIFFFVLYSNYFALVPASAASAFAGSSMRPRARGRSHIPPSATFASLPGYCADGKVIPALRAPSSDLNVTLAWALARCS